MLFNRLAVPALILVAVLPYQVMAETITGKITVTANISSSCQVTTTDSKNPVTADFGLISFDTSDWMSHKEINATPLKLTVTCTSGSAPVVKLNQGTGYSEDSWHMVNQKSADAKIAYQLYSDISSRTLIKPDTDINTSKQNPFNMVIAGQILPISDAASVTAGEYQDTIQMTVDWSGN